MKILIVDDKAPVRLAMVKILNQLEFKDITQAVDGEDAWYKINASIKGDSDQVADQKIDQKFDVVISDLEMPKMTGLELLRKVRSSQDVKDMVFIMATTVTAKQIIIETMRLGIQAYIVKPFDLPMVEFKLKQAGIL